MSIGPMLSRKLSCSCWKFNGPTCGPKIAKGKTRDALAAVDSSVGYGDISTLYQKTTVSGAQTARGPTK